MCKILICVSIAKSLHTQKNVYQVCLNVCILPIILRMSIVMLYVQLHGSIIVNYIMLILIVKYL